MANSWSIIKKPPMTPEEIDSYIDEVVKMPELKVDNLVHMYRAQGEKCEAEGNKFDSKWEAIFYFANKYVYNKVIERNTKDFLYYLDLDGKQRKFYYDFILNGEKCEVKGRFRESDKQKQLQCPEVKFYSGEDIKQMRKDLVKKMPDWESYLAKRI